MGDGTLKGGLEAAQSECSSPCVGSRKGVSPGENDCPGLGLVSVSQGGYKPTQGSLGTFFWGGGCSLFCFYIKQGPAM